METINLCCRDQQEVEGTLVQTYLPMAALVSMFSLYNKNEMKLGWLTGQASWVPRLSNTPSRFLSRSPRSPPSSSRPRLRLPPFFPFAFTRTRMHFPSLPEKQTGGKRKQVSTKSTRATEERQQPVEMHLASKDCGKDYMHVVPQCLLGVIPPSSSSSYPRGPPLCRRPTLSANVSTACECDLKREQRENRERTEREQRENEGHQGIRRCKLPVFFGGKLLTAKHAVLRRGQIQHRVSRRLHHPFQTHRSQVTGNARRTTTINVSTKQEKKQRHAPPYLAMSSDSNASPSSFKAASLSSVNVAFGLMTCILPIKWRV